MVDRSLYLIDASIYIFRAYFTISERVTDGDGAPFNAVYGYGHFLCDVLERVAADYVAVAFDESLTSSFRNDLYPDYKANRESPPPELVRQFKQCQTLTDALGLAAFSDPRYEADDLIATIAHDMRPHAFKTIIVSADKDLAQVLRTKDVLWDFARNRRFQTADIESRFGVSPCQIPDYLALAGDSVDNIPGVTGVGPKTAVRLLRQFGDLDGIYRNLNSVAGLDLRGAGRIGRKLGEAREKVYLWRCLTTVAVDAPVRCSLSTLRRRSVDQVKVERLLDLIKPRRLQERIMRIAKQ